MKSENVFMYAYVLEIGIAWCMIYRWYVHLLFIKIYWVHNSKNVHINLCSASLISVFPLCSSCIFRPRLPEYLLDFGYVVLGTVRTHVVKATNTGWFPASFQVERDDIHHYGFHVELDRVRNLPGAPDHETVDYVVSFDPRGANLQLGPVETVVSINVCILSSTDCLIKAEK